MKEPDVAEVEPTPACPVCAKPNPDRTWAVCAKDVTRVDKMLGELVELHALAHRPGASMPGQSGTTDGPVSGSHERPIGVNVAILDLGLGEDLLGVLECWERWFREEFGYPPYGIASGDRLERAVRHETAEEVTLTGCIRFLRAQWPLAAQKHPAADEFAAEVRQLWTRANRTMGLTEPRPWTFPCPADLPSGALCGYRLRVDYAGRDLHIHCPRCSTDWTLTRLRLVGMAAGTAAWVDAESAARALGCDVGHLGPLVRDGRIRVRGDKDHRRYDINSIRRDTPSAEMLA